MRARLRTPAVAAGSATVLSLATIASIAGLAPAGAAVSARTPLAGSALVAAARQHPAGAVSKSAPISFELVLKLRDAAGAKALVRAVSTPGSASYRHYLTSAGWEARFSPTAATVATARKWLASEGFKVGATSADRITISASGSAARVEKAFGTGLANYTVKGRVIRLATRKLSLPSSVAGSISGAMGINQTIAKPAVAAAPAARTEASATAKGTFPPPPSAFITSPPCSRYYGQKVQAVKPPFGHGYASRQPLDVCGYKPGQLRSAYGVGSGNAGQGATVAVIDAYGSATIASDSARYFSMNDPGNPFSRAHFSELNALPFNNESLCAASGWATEQAIDVQSVHSMAPHAHILYVGAKNCLNGLFTAEQTVVDHHLANVVTNSWGDDAGDLLDDVATKTAYDDVFMMADATGMTVQFSSGDNGDNFNLFGLSSPDFPAVSPYVTAVGGTTLYINAKGKQSGQIGWATGRSFKCTANVVGGLPGCTKAAVGHWLPVSYDGGGGGFTSYDFTQPAYQAGVVPAALAERNAALTGTTKMRVEPDISMEADPATGFLIGLHEIFPNGSVHYGETRYGGTSLASPLLAGVIADADSAAGSAVGFVNPAIYALHSAAGAEADIVPARKQATLRYDHAFTYVPGATGKLEQFRENTYEGVITYCDATGNCASRDNTLTTAKGYDSMTGLGSIGPYFVTDLAKG